MTFLNTIQEAKETPLFNATKATRHLGKMNTLAVPRNSQNSLDESSRVHLDQM